MPHTQLAYQHIEKAVLTGEWTTTAESELLTGPEGGKFLITTVTYRESKTRRRLLVTYEGKTIRAARWADGMGGDLVGTHANHLRKSLIERELGIARPHAFIS